MRSVACLQLPACMHMLRFALGVFLHKLIRDTVAQKPSVCIVCKTAEDEYRLSSKMLLDTIKFGKKRLPGHNRGEYCQRSPSCALGHVSFRA